MRPKLCEKKASRGQFCRKRKKLSCAPNPVIEHRIAFETVLCWSMEISILYVYI